MKLFERAVQGVLRLLKMRLVRLWCHLLFVRLGTEHFRRAKDLEGFLLREHLGQLLKQFEVNCVIDVGANAGQYALGLRRLGYDGHIVSFEPVGALYERLKTLSEADPKWSVHRLALGGRDGEAEINVTRADVFSSLLKPNDASARHFGNGAEVTAIERVPLRRLDTVLDELLAHLPEPRAFLKMDTQGYDLEVFAGLGRWAGRAVGLQSEVSLIPIYEGMPRMSDSLSAYEAAGFEVAGLYPVSRDRATARVIEYDCTMVRAAAASPSPAREVAHARPAHARRNSPNTEPASVTLIGGRLGSEGGRA